ncbi:ABC transporter ATP-binding protein [Actinomyces oris]|uniref:ABC transporter ATP-binding protein n=1 Tax=Actinomyces oris TaxID=544580 RepID=A0AAE4G212_9ACTO|nr:ABC transporter ATP-binding protein [Actinomyces oris]MDT0248356.1 ABC transporter ATP-binding protein [Actinomyces oris]
MSTATPRTGREATVTEDPRTDHMDAVRLTDLHKSFGDVTAVDGVDLTIRPGEVVALLGPNGAGKTTTIDMILGLSRPTNGDARVFGMSPRQAVDRGLVAAVMQTAGLLPDITVRETVQLTASLFSHRIDAEEAMHRAGVTDFASRIVKKCSGGQQQRLRFAMALVSDPALLILDEPTTGMDVEGRRSFWEAIHADAERGRTIVFATHYLEEADAFADRIVLMRHGRIIADGTAAEIRASVSGRSLRATLTCTPAQLHSALTDLQTRGRIHDIEILGNTLTLSSTDTDAVAALLLGDHLAKDLEITSRGLEDAFMALTSDSASAPSTGASA